MNPPDSMADSILVRNNLKCAFNSIYFVKSVAGRLVLLLRYNKLLYKVNRKSSVDREC